MPSCVLYVKLWLGLPLIHFIAVPSAHCSFPCSLVLPYFPSHSYVLSFLGEKKGQNSAMHSQGPAVNKAVGSPRANFSHMFTCRPSTCSCLPQVSTGAVPSSRICPHTCHSHHCVFTQPYIYLSSSTHLPDLCTFYPPLFHYCLFILLCIGLFASSHSHMHLQSHRKREREREHSRIARYHRSTPTDRPWSSFLS